MSQTVMLKNNTWQKLQKVLKGGKKPLKNAMIKSTLVLIKTRNSFFFLQREMITAFSQCIRKFFNL